MKKHITLFTFMMMIIILIVVKRISALAYEQPRPLKTNAIASARLVSGHACHHESLFIGEQKNRRHARTH